MALQTFQMHLYAKERLTFDADAPVEVQFKLHMFPDADYIGSYVGPVEVQAEVPDAFDMHAAKLRDKQAELQKVRAEFTNRITQLQRELNELLAIDMEAA